MVNLLDEGLSVESVEEPVIVTPLHGGIYKFITYSTLTDIICVTTLTLSRTEKNILLHKFLTT